jgi:PAS domain S-box-containing protein
MSKNIKQFYLSLVFYSFWMGVFVDKEILLIGLNEEERKIIKGFLKEYSVIIAKNSQEALFIMETHPDLSLILLDLDADYKDGIQFLKSVPLGVINQRIILLTNPKDPKKEVEALNLGAIDYIRKPISEKSFKTRIKIHFELLSTEYLDQGILEKGSIFDALFQQAPMGIVISYANDPCQSDRNSIVRINPLLTQIIGRTKEEILELGWEKIIHPEDLEIERKYFKRFQDGEINSYSLEKRFLKPDGTVVWVHTVVLPLTIANKNKYGYICFVQDISQRREMENNLAESERSKSVFLAHLPGMAYRCNNDEEWTMQYVSAGCLQLTGYPPESLLFNRDLSFRELIVPVYQEPIRLEWDRILKERIPFEYEYEIITATGERKWVLEMGQGVFTEEGEIEALEGIILDISDRKQMEKELRYNSEREAFTGLYNRRYLITLLEQHAKVLSKSKRALIAINLSAIHLLAMTYGFQYGREFIKKAVESLNTLTSDKHILFNVLENKFVYYIKEYKDEKELTLFCQSIIELLEPLLAVEGINGGIGVIKIEDYNKEDVEQLLRNLLVASEKAAKIYDKDIGICFFDREMEAHQNREEIINWELNQIAAGENIDRLFLEYQPILDLNKNEICGFEALARLNSDRLGLVPPLEFIPLAEKTKLIVPLGQEIISQALWFLKELNREGYNSINVTINISLVQLLRNDFVKNLVTMSQDLGIDPRNVGLEITESMFAIGCQEINKILGELKRHGFTIAIDDFGTAIPIWPRSGS